jgi:hypothetical protein
MQTQNYSKKKKDCHDNLNFFLLNMFFSDPNDSQRRRNGKDIYYNIFHR